ncbi:protein kinase domain-containing protein, partial [Haematococcus lacustris]
MSSAQGSHQPSSSSHTQSAWTSSLLGTEHHGSTSSARLHSQGCSLSTANTHSSSSAARQQPHPQPQPQPTAQLTGTTDPHRGTVGPQAHPNTPTHSVAQQGTGMGTTPAQLNPAPRPLLKLDPEPSEHPPTAVGLAQHVQPGGNEQSADTHASPQPDVSASLPPTAEGSVVASSNMSSIPTWTTYVPTAAHPVPSPCLVEPSSHAAPDPAPHPPTPHPPSPHPSFQLASGLAPGTSTSQPPTPSSAAAPSTSDPIEAPSAVGGAHSSLLPKSSAKAVQAATAISASSIDSSALQQRLTPPWSLAQSLGINSFASDKKGRGQEEGLSGARGPRAAAQASTFAKLVATWRGAGKQGLGPPSTLSPTLDATLAAAPAGPGKGTPTHAPDPAGKQAQPAAPAMGLGQAGQGQARHVAVQQTGQNAAGAVAQPTQGQGGARRASQKPMHMAEELAALRRLTESVEFPGGLGRQAVPLSSSVNSRGSPGARVDLASQDLQLPARLRIFMLMEFCDAGSLQDAVDRGWLRVEHGNARTPLHAARSMAVITDIACGLGYLHARGVVHADLSASNILLCKRAPCMLSSRPESVTAGLGRLPVAAVPKPSSVADTAPKSGGSGVAATTGSALETTAARGETTCKTGTWAGTGALPLGAMPHAPTTTDRAPATAEHARPAAATACLPDPSAIAAAALPPPAGATAAPVPQQALAAMRTQAAAGPGPGPGPGSVTQTATLSHQGSLAAPSTPVVAQGVVAITLPRAKSGKPGQPARLASTAPLEAAAANEESKGISLLPPAQRYVVTDAGQVESTEVQYVAKVGAVQCFLFHIPSYYSDSHFVAQSDMAGKKRPPVRSCLGVRIAGPCKQGRLGMRWPMCSSRTTAVRSNRCKGGRGWEGISDFGKSRVLNPEGVIEVGSYATVTHMAPEVLRDRRLSPAADVYSFGVLCWQFGPRPAQVASTAAIPARQGLVGGPAGPGYRVHGAGCQRPAQYACGAQALEIANS